MFPIAHAWLLEHVVAAPTTAQYLGCVWPDMLFESPLDHEQSHKQGAQLAMLARAQPHDTNGDEFRAFVTGALSHGAEPHGFDWYSDEQWGNQPREARGYAFQRAVPLAAEAARACGLPVEQGWWKAHNLIEQAFEVPLYTADPHLGERLSAACADTALISRIAQILAPHFAVEAAELATPMVRYAEMVALRPREATDLAHAYARQVREKHQTVADIPALVELLTRARSLIAADSETYLSTCAASVSAMLHGTSL